jgi:hypothetical protein
MKKILLFSACVLLVFSACKKDSAKTASSNTITATVGGSNINFSTNATGELATDSGAYVLAVGGLTGTSSSAQSIVVGLLSDKPFVKGTYTFDTSTDPNTITVLPSIAYLTNTSGDESSEFDSNTDIYLQNSTLSTTCTVTITSISSTNIQGTFNGLLTNDGDNTTTKTVTNGKFNVGLKTVNAGSLNTRISAAKLRSFKNRILN